MHIELPGQKPQNYIVEAIRDLSNDIEFSHQQKLSSLGFWELPLPTKSKITLVQSV